VNVKRSTKVDAVDATLVADEEKNPRRRHIRGTIGAHLVALVAVQLILILGLIGFAGWQDFRSARTSAAAAVAVTAHQASEWLDEQVEENRTQLDSLPQFADLLASPQACAFTTADQQEQWNEDGELSSRFFLNRFDGSPMCPATNGAASPNFATAGWFKRAVTTGETVEVGPVVDQATGHLVLMYAAPIASHNSVVTVSVDLSSAGPSLLKRFGKTDPVPSFVVTTADRSMAISSSDGRKPRKLSATPYSKPIADGNRTFEDLNGEPRINAEANTDAFGWHVFAGVTTADALADARNSLRSRSILAAMIFLVMIATAMFLQRRFVRPIRGLARATRRISDGELNARVTPSGPVELVGLADSFNTMADVRSKAEAALRKAYRAEQRAADELREVDEMRQAFLMAISHELRTPLTSVVGFASFLQDAREDMSEEELDRAIDAIAGNSKRLERLLMDLLDVERLSRGIVEPNLQETDVRDVVMRAIERSSGGTRISAPIPKPVPATVDPALVERIIENLVNNAVKHTPVESKIWVKASRRNGDLKLTVEDNGPGVPDDLKLGIFEPFKQGDVPSHAPGTGVGLSLVAQFAKLHGGRAWVDDRRGGGAAFHVVIPAKAHDAKRRSRRTDKVKPAA
jgi:signal transduction histidine kinase